ncbi:Secreted protein [Mycena indigotica]|uniref:Secreted protein n=1 Tax=Mycena indigotica TaxID=2126181 RepID=A0A8H6T2X1_9AGAR|nr:Secreted protein [Mycena indigotica]KAF7309266.1 Secreted protein [Mycena indigotica]
MNVWRHICQSVTKWLLHPWRTNRHRRSPNSSMLPHILPLLQLSALFLPAYGHRGPPAWYTRNKNTIQTIYNLTIYPANAVIITQGAAAVPPGLFATNATGRVAPVGEFDGFQDSIEYFWGLAPLPNTGGVIVSATLQEFTSGCPEVAASTVYLRINSVNDDGSDAGFLTTLKQTAFWNFDSTGAVQRYDAFIPNLDPLASLTHGFGDNVDAGVGLFSPAGMAKLIGAVCEAQAQTCVGPDQVYSDANDCIATLSAKPFGRFDEAWGDNVACRSIHVLLTSIRPDVHCAHVGPTGGGKCIQKHYTTDYFDDTQLFGPKKVFSCETYW